ncbi:hypothetical protein VB711_25950 [Cronbergia sp. UHCC 0137]|uniref:hypothetical protein n=1 Tax=Cronbergia sp. UHCC 0137 TaxID=3110239 RepID=UPI002B220895|nr:hypothetical protein [Cronbergia sp. UHCC 0137]MEA5621251.1 hypothetical protein [Cronbergia sp. UHCC 0137]
MKQPIPSFKIQKLPELKSRLDKEKNLSRVWEFYMDHFSDHKEFTDLGEPIKDSFLEKVVPLISKKIFKETSQDLFLITIPEYQFIHGSFFVGNRIGALIYFEQSLKGMIAISELPPSNMVQYSRFSGQKLD